MLIAKIARLDCPRQWPELLPTLLQAVRCEETLTQQRALLVLHHVIKALASKRLASDRIAFEEVLNFLSHKSQFFNCYTLLIFTNFFEAFPASDEIHNHCDVIFPVDE